MTEDSIQNLVSDMFSITEGKNGPQQIRYMDYVKIIIDHPVTNTFINGGGTVMYGMGR
jgi:hypothetical protein